MERARQAIRALIDLTPREALVRRNGRDQRMPVDAIALGDEIVVRPGEKIPLDGLVVTGHSDVNEAPLTGESRPIDKEPGDEVYAGTINGRGAMEVRVLRLGRDSRLARIIHLVETRADTAGARPVVRRSLCAHLYAAGSCARGCRRTSCRRWLPAAPVSTWVYRALVLLVIACPCALVISTPVSIVAALSVAARHGVLIKGGAYLERLASIRDRCVRQDRHADERRAERHRRRGRRTCGGARRDPARGGGRGAIGASGCVGHHTSRTGAAA